MKKLHVYQYQFIDDLTFIKPAKEIFGASERKKIKEIKELFKKSGWDGDGEIGIIWLPPFLDNNDTEGIFLWHVKQSHHGISFIASPIEIPFGYLGKSEKNIDVLIEISNNSTQFKKYLNQTKNELIQEINKLNSFEDNQIIIGIREKILIFNQNNLIAKFKNLLDLYYLLLLQEKYLYHNKKIKINAKTMRIMNINRDNEPDDLPEHAKRWLISADFISFIWANYKNCSLNEKFDLLSKSIDYKPPEEMVEIVKIIKIHHELRNCIHHFDSKLSAEAHKRLGVKIIKLDGKPIRLGDQISFNSNNLINLIEVLNGFLDYFINYLKFWWISMAPSQGC